MPGNTSGGITIASRGSGSGIEFDGVSGYVDLGKHNDECFQSPDVCSNGITYSMWIWTGSGRMMIIDSGAFDRYTVGYNMQLSNNVLGVNVKFGNNNKHLYRVDDWNQDHWEHVVWTWSPTHGIRFFLNGCDTDPGATKGLFSHKVIADVHPSDQVPFVIGATAIGYVKNANMKLDDMYIWNQAFTDNDVWTFYVNGGVAWRSSL